MPVAHRAKATPIAGPVVGVAVARLTVGLYGSITRSKMRNFPLENP